MRSEIMTLQSEAVSTLDELYVMADQLDVTPGWVNRSTPIFWADPRTSFVPVRWDYQEVRSSLDAAGRLIDVDLAERRNLVLRNPHPNNDFATTRAFSCAYQMILPGEVAPTHRHSPHAVRVMLDAVGTYSVVDGVRIPMESGDVVLTPGGGWHGHGHDGDEPAYWFDALDIPLVHLLEPMMYEEHPDRYAPIVSRTDTSPYRFRARDIQDRLDATAPAPDGSYGARITLDAPEMPSMGLTVERLPSGVTTSPHRSNANRVFVVMDGHGTTTVGDAELSWTRGDTVVVPTWSTFHHHAGSDATLFGVSDEPVMRALNYYCE
jgi:gentisate 1,2-dioxygenase